MINYYSIIILLEIFNYRRKLQGSHTMRIELKDKIIDDWKISWILHGF